MLIRTLPTLIKIFCKIKLNFQVIIISIEEPDNNFKSSFKSINGLIRGHNMLYVYLVCT